MLGHLYIYSLLLHLKALWLNVKIGHRSHVKLGLILHKDRTKIGHA